MIDEFAAIGCCNSLFDRRNKTSLTFQHAGNRVFHQLFGVLAIGKRHLLKPVFDIRREMNFHAVLKIRNTCRFRQCAFARDPYNGESGNAIARHMCATGLLSIPQPFFRLLELAADDVEERSSDTFAFGSNAYRSFTVTSRGSMYHLWFRTYL